MAEGPEGIGSQLEELDAEGYADDSDAHQKAHDEVDEGDNDSTQNQPEDITENIHKSMLIGPANIITKGEYCKYIHPTKNATFVKNTI